MNVISQRHIVNASEEKIYTSISDCRNFEKFLPQEMKDVEVTAESCKFTIPGSPPSHFQSWKRESSQKCHIRQQMTKTSL